MFQGVKVLLEISSTPSRLHQASVARALTESLDPSAQTIAPNINPLEQTVSMVSGSQFLIALIAGVLMAFAFQFLLTNLTVATGISSDSDLLDADSDESWGDAVRKVESKVGAVMLLIVNLAVFMACFLAVKLTLIHSLAIGAIVSVVIWSAYFLILLWLSSTAINSVVGSVVSTASSGMQGIVATVGAALAGRSANAQIVNTVEASVAAVRRELGSAIDPVHVRETVQDYLTDLQLPKLNLQQIRHDFEHLLTGSELRSLGDSDLLQTINRQTFVDLVSNRTDLSKRDVNRIADQLESAWHYVLGQRSPTDPQSQLLNFLQSASPQELTSSQLGDKLKQLVAVGSPKGQGTNRGNGNGTSLMGQTLNLGVGALVDRVMSRTDLSDVDIEKISTQLQQLTHRATDEAKHLSAKFADKLPGLSFNTIQADVEAYLLNAQPWHLNRETIKQEFKDVLYDPEASPKAVRQQLEQLNWDSLSKVLESRGIFAPEKITEIKEQLIEIQKEVLNTVQTAEFEDESQSLRNRVENYLRSTGKDALNPEGIERDFKALLEDSDTGFENLSRRLSQLDRDTLIQMLKEGRQDFSEEELHQLVSQLESTRDRVLSESQNLRDQAEHLGQRIENYLRNTNKEELNPDAIEQELQTLFQDPQAGFSSLRQRFSQFDRDTLIQLLNQRGDLSEEQIHQIVDRFFSVWHQIFQAPQELVGTAKEQFDRLTHKIAEYLQRTNLEELDPEGIKQDLTQLLDDPKQGALALRERLSQIDRETLVKLLSQREDLSEEQVNQAIDRVQQAIRGLIKSPRRLASRAQATVNDFQANFVDYLRNTQKEELNPEGIKRDLQQLFNDPREGWNSVRDRLSQFDRGTLVSLLSQREDISEEEANQIADNLESARDRLVEQAQAVQQRMQSAIDSVFGKIRTYLNSLDRPELNYEGIKQDLRKVFDDPEAGFEALRDRLSQFDRETLVAVLSSREDISPDDANRIINHIEEARDRVLHRAERLQAEANKRVKQLKHKAIEQMVETRKAAATAAWWLFGTALSSVAVAAFAGILAVGGLSL